MSSGYLTTVLDISKCRYDAMTLLIDALTEAPILFSNAASCMVNPYFVTSITVVFDLFSWIVITLLRLVPFTTHLISISDLPIATKEGSTSMDMEPNAEEKQNS